MQTAISPQRQRYGAITLQQIQDFVEYEASLLDERRFREWYDLFADDGLYWVPALHGQEDGHTAVSLFFDDKHMLQTRITRLEHPHLHCQEPRSHTARVVSSVKLESSPITEEILVSSRFIMIEDRLGAPQRLFGGRYMHRVRQISNGRLEIVQKRVELTNCDHSFPALTQPF